ncbi:APC family permease [Halorussus vallis]|nr:APC family permease [Halorussus vallis]
MALGGMIGGGIYSAFGIVVAIAGKVAWLAFLIAGGIAMCAGYSYVKLNELTDDHGGAPTYLEDIVGNSTIAGMTGWTLLFGYIGSMALYAYAFSSFFSEMIGRLHFMGVPVANTISVLLIAAFVGLNLMGASETGKAEDVLTFFKVVVIGGFGVWGVWYAFTAETLTFGFGSLGFSPVIGAAMSFVAFQGWQLLMYDQDQFENPEENIRKAIYFSIPVATLLYVLVAFTTVSILELSVIAVAPEVSLLYAALPFMGRVGAFIIGLSALFSTASAVNATLFSGAQFSRDLIDSGLLPQQFQGDGDQEVPSKLVIVLGALSAAFAVYGSLSSITSFASLAFIAVFGAMSYLAFRERDDIDDLLTPVPVVGMVGTGLFFPLLLYNLWLNDPGTFYLVLLISIVVVGSELIYFEREPIEQAVPGLEHD